jgi:hypothetical protein
MVQSEGGQANRPPCGGLFLFGQNLKIGRGGGSSGKWRLINKPDEQEKIFEDS